MPLGGRLAIPAVAIALALAGCAGQEIANQESLLAAAGFRVLPANTPEREASLRSLPPGELVLVPRNGKSAWMYADPYRCHCLYVGGEHAYQAYARLAVHQRIAETRLQDAQLNAMNWNAWGWGPWPSGPFGPYNPWSY